MDTIKQAMQVLRQRRQRDQAMRRLRERGVPLEAIGKKYGVSKQRVWSILRRAAQ
jgi:DNA-directed RNA polymerase sigma subunit (sigma70/sigma32)